MTKLVSLSEEAYSILHRMKGKKLSFSQVIVKLVNTANPKRNFLQFAGVLRSQSKELEQFKKQIDEDRKRNIEVGE